MEALLAEFKAVVAAAKAEFRAHSKEERKELRSLRKQTNAYVEKVTREWRVEKEEERQKEKQVIRNALIELAGRHPQTFSN